MSVELRARREAAQPHASVQQRRRILRPRFLDEPHE